jgi:hypothetical protein
MEQRHIFKSFLFFYKEQYKEVPFYSETSQKLCNTFIDLLIKNYSTTERLGYDFLWMYFTYQFSYWKKVELKSFNKKINIPLIIGKKAFLRYVTRDVQYDWQIIQDSRTYSRKDFEKYVSLPQHNISDTRYNSDDRYRREEFNTEIGLSACITYTSLYDYKSNYCKSCIYKKQCTEVQQQIYPQIYLNRKIENGSKQTAAR